MLIKGTTGKYSILITENQTKLQGLKNVFDEAIKIVLNPVPPTNFSKLALNIKKHRDLGKLKREVADEDFDVNFQDKDGFSLLHFAAQADNPEAIRILLQSVQINPNLKSWQEQSTPLMVACEAGNLEAMKALLESSKISLSAQNRRGQTVEQIMQAAPDIQTPDTSRHSLN